MPGSELQSYFIKFLRVLCGFTLPSVLNPFWLPKGVGIFTTEYPSEVSRFEGNNLVVRISEICISPHHTYTKASAGGP
jgi:hypothetical protein